MLVIILNILKIIGFILLAIIGLVFLLLFIVLFVPIRYKAVGEYKNKKPDILLNASFLLHILSVSFIFKENKPVFCIKVFGIKLKKKKSRPKSADHTAGSDFADSNNDEINSANVDNDSKSNSDEANSDKANNKENSANNTDDNLHKKNSLKDKLTFYYGILKSDSFKAALGICKDRIGKIIKSILPKRGRINMWLGFENAGTTGEIVGYYKALYSYIGHVVKLYSFYDRECTDIDFNIKGRIYTFVIIYHLICILLNKNIRIIIKKVKRNKKRNS